jgi:hypothetical protein
MFNDIFSTKSCRILDNVDKYGTARQDTDENMIIRMHFACWVAMVTDKTFIAFPQQRWLRESS